MKKTVSLLVLMLLLQPLLQFCGCGGAESGSPEEELALYAVHNILVPGRSGSDFVAVWMRQSTGSGDVSPEELGQLFWKCEGGTLSEISRQEYRELAAMREGGDPDAWTYSQHSVTVLEVDEGKGEAIVEIGSLYNMLSASGVRYLLHKEDGEWKKVSESVVWGS